MTAALDVARLQIAVDSHRHRVPMVTDVSFELAPGEALGIVGESGAGKSLMARAIAGLLPRGTELSGGAITLPDGPEVRVAMIFQEPLAAMNPTMRVVDLIADSVRSTVRMPRAAARERALQLMADVGVPDVTRRARQWPHELSGGLRQRVGIAMALALEPTVLLCDEPTTALDVTIQDQILGLLDRLRRERRLSLIFISHDLAVVATVCQRVAVMYAGQIVEIGATDVVLTQAWHPYTQGLIAARRVRGDAQSVRAIEGQPPVPGAYPAGCRFAERCPYVRDRCRRADYSLQPPGLHATACIRVQNGEELT